MQLPSFTTNQHINFESTIFKDPMIVRKHFNNFVNGVNVTDSQCLARLRELTTPEFKEEFGQMMFYSGNFINDLGYYDD
jgi:regulatory protein YycH of two-component signal transduction system YycFG